MVVDCGVEREGGRREGDHAFVYVCFVSGFRLTDLSENHVPSMTGAISREFTEMDNILHDAPLSR